MTINWVSGPASDLSDTFIVNNCYIFIHEYIITIIIMSQMWEIYIKIPQVLQNDLTIRKREWCIQGGPTNHFVLFAQTNLNDLKKKFSRMLYKKVAFI